MPGFPLRFLRSALGPELIDSAPVENPETDIGARQFNLAFWQMAGANLIVPRATVVARWDGSAFVIAHQAEAWNTEGAQAHPLLERQEEGSYTYTFAANYLDENGAAIATVLGPPRVSCHRALADFSERVITAAWIDPGDPLVVQVRLWDADGIGVDHPFWLEVL